MPRFPRNFLKTSFFHVITQGLNKSYIFEEVQDIKYYIHTMYKLTKDYKIKIIAYCIMNNHAHILIESTLLEELSKYMQRLNTRYGIYYNKKHNRIGYVFRDRYKAEGIYSEKHLYNCINYIYNNPVKAGICQKAKDYPYSNYKDVNIDLSDEYVFIDVDNDNEVCQRIIKDFLKKTNIKKSDLKYNREKLKDLIILLKEKNHISLRQISKELTIGRETIRRIYNE